MTTQATDTVLAAACRQAGLSASGAEVIRASENTLYRLPGKVVARVTRSGQLAAAQKEVQVSCWLQSLGVPVVEALPELAQPVEVEGRAVTFWRELPPHRYSTMTELADTLRLLHSLPSPAFTLPPVAPFVRLKERIAEARAFTSDDRAWLLNHLAVLEERYAALPPGLPYCAIHGDAWAGNVVVTDEGPVLLDLERFAYGPPEWDLTGIAVDYTTFGDLPEHEWKGFAARYGSDVTEWVGYEILRDARELRKVTFAAQLASEREEYREQALYRLACVRGDMGPRPWGWVGVPYGDAEAAFCWNSSNE